MRRGTRGFALVLTLALLGLLVLAIFALSALVRVNGQVSASSTTQLQARQNALLALRVALGELQKVAGPDARVTGIGGLTASVSGNNHPARYWCGVWNGSQVTWLASGSTNGTIPNLGASDLAIVANGSLGAYASTNENDFVRVLKVPVSGPRADGSFGILGAYAFWVGDEGTKLSAKLGDAETAISGGKHELSALITALSPTSPQLANATLYEQLSSISGVSAANRRGSFHQLTLTHRSVRADGSGLLAGTMNVNSSSVRFWRAVGQTYNRLKPSSDPMLTSTSVSATSFAGRMSARVKAVGPYRSVGDFFGDAEVKKIVEDNSASWSSFRTTLEPWTVVRSDTFRVRAYGEAANPIDSSNVEASAYCEAIVQRETSLLVSAVPTLGRRFVVVQLRWLSPPNTTAPLESDI